MKFQISIVPARGLGREDRGGFSPRPKLRAQGPVAAFTMIEIAICLAIIGFALVAIIGVLPYGMSTQRDNRQETIIGQDASMLLEAIRSGARGADDLTNYVYAITNRWQRFDNLGQPVGSPGEDAYTFTNAVLNGTADAFYRLTNGAHIIGVLSTPEFAASYGGPPISDTFGRSYVSNHVSANIRSLSGLVAEKPPQNNQIMREDAFSYLLYCVNAPMAVDTNHPVTGYNWQLAGNQRELRLTFRWPWRPNGNVGNGRQTFRATVAGQLTQDPTNFFLFFYQPQSFKKVP
jgi:type II secretory pathway pseudopilin PulG